MINARSADAADASVRPRRLLTGTWRQELRLQPWTLIGTTVALGAAWAVESHLDLAIERSLLVLLTTVALSLSVSDSAATMTGASPTPLVVRRAARAGPAVVVLAASWAVLLVVVLTMGATEVEPAPWWALMLEWCAVAGSQVALASTAPPLGAARSIAPGALLGLVWVAAIQAAPTHRRLYPVADHAAAWILVLFASSVAFAWFSADPARRTDRRHSRPGRVSADGVR